MIPFRGTMHSRMSFRVNTLGSYISKDKMSLVREKAEVAFGQLTSMSLLRRRPNADTYLTPFSTSCAPVELESRFEEVRSSIDGLQGGSEEVQSAIAAFTSVSSELRGNSGALGSSMETDSTNILPSL